MMMNLKPVSLLKLNKSYINRKLFILSDSQIAIKSLASYEFVSKAAIKSLASYEFVS